MRIFKIVIGLCIFTTNSQAQDRITSDPGSAKIVFSDIKNFWTAFDLLQKQHTTADSLNIIRTVFLNNASEGLKLYMKAANCYEAEYLEAIRKKKMDYLAVRRKTEMIAGEKQAILNYLHKFKKIYPALKIPVICFTMGKFEVGGTQFDNTLFIGCEKDIDAGVDIIAQAIHELAHFQQKDQNPVTNLELAMIEGGAEFVCYRVTGRRTIYPAWNYGLHHEQKLWNDFRPVLDSAIDMKWFRDITDNINNRPGSLGYFIGFRICESFLAHAENKNTSLEEIIKMENPEGIFLSAYYR
jgi:hypothetical protein